MKQISLILGLLIIVGFNSSHAQTFQQKFDGINFNIHGNTSMAPFNGGMDNGRFQILDIDGDGLKDMFTFDDDTTLYFYKNIGTASNAHFKLITTKYQGLSIKNWFYFTDIDGDGLFDLYSGTTQQRIQFFKNTGNQTNPQFTLQVSEVKTNTDSVIYTDANSSAVFADVDNDGDKDFFTGLSIGSMRFFENIGTPTNPSFKFITDIWEDIIVLSPARPIRTGREHPLFDNERHGANTFEFADLDGDNDLDVFFGDYFSRGIYYIHNSGTPNDPDMAILDSNYPGNQPFDSEGFNMVRMVDIDGDNDLDMFVSVVISFQAINNFTLYKNNGTSSAPVFDRVTDNYLNNVDVGSNSVPVFTDVTGDGLPDLFIGASSPIISFYRNTGNINAPSFNLEIDTLPIDYGANFNFAPGFADIDNDGDKDMFVGGFLIGQSKFYKNTGTASNFNYVFESTASGMGIDSLGQSSTPVFVDIDKDGDYDFFSGDWNGRIHYYENTGTPSNYNYEFRSKFYNGIDVGDESIPRFYDIDGDDDYDLFIGRADGRISYYRNDGSTTTPNFVLITNSYKDIYVTRNAAPYFIDIENDTDVDLFIGNIKGGLYYFNNTDVIGIQNISTTAPNGYNLKQNYPNPFNPSTNISFDIPKSSFVELKIYDISGREIANLVSQDLNPGSYNYSWDAQNLSSGVYFYTLNAGGFISTKKMLLLK
jgi:hypothetical protein